MLSVPNQGSLLCSVSKVCSKHDMGDPRVVHWSIQVLEGPPHDGWL